MKKEISSKILETLVFTGSIVLALISAVLIEDNSVRLRNFTPAVMKRSERPSQYQSCTFVSLESFTVFETGMQALGLIIFTVTRT